MTTDLIARLRCHGAALCLDDCTEAANALEAKEREIAELREKLDISQHCYEAIQAVCTNDQVTMIQIIKQRDTLAEQNNLLLRLVSEAVETDPYGYEHGAEWLRVAKAVLATGGK